MPDNTLKPALHAALRMHEIGTQTPYKLFFAGKGRSGASFGAMQGDLAAGQPVVRATFTNAMTAAGMVTATIASLLQRLSVHLLGNPLNPAERGDVDAALAASIDLVDAMDEAILAEIYASLDICIAHATAGRRRMDPEAQILAAMWINMTGPPTKLLTWIDGGTPALATPVPAPGKLIDAAAMEAYLHATDYYTNNPQNFPHLLESLAAGVEQLPRAGGRGVSRRSRMVAARAGGTRSIPAATKPPALPDAGYVYEQATGHMFAREDGLNDLLATGYSGSEADGGKNNPDKQCESDIGPIPRGTYSIGDPFAGPSPFSLRLTPAPGNEMCGRSGFLIPGDSIAAPGTASHGCIILPRPVRERIYQARLGKLVVVARLG